MSPRCRVLAFFLPQFHPIPENDAWWGRGFTEWINVVRATPQFRGHRQPHLPADLGFYDLRVPETREAQAELAGTHGVDGFCYYHYWFNGRRLLERPFAYVLASGRPDFPFCLCWANENWTRAWDGGSSEVLIEQRYSLEDDMAHVRALAPAFSDPRYVRVSGRPLFLVYRAGRLPDPRRTTDTWRAEAVRLGVGELYLCRVEAFGERSDPRPLGFDAGVEFQPDFGDLGDQLTRSHRWRLRHGMWRNQASHRVFDYGAVARRMVARPPAPFPRFRCVTPMWDNTARRKRAAVILAGSTPERYEAWLRAVLESVASSNSGEDVVFVNAWNEWAEGNHLEPCQRWGRAYLEATLRARSGGPRAVIPAPNRRPGDVAG